MNDLLNPTVARLTARSLLGRRRTVLLALLPLALLAISVLARVLGSLDDDIAGQLQGSLSSDLLATFGIAVLMPLLGLVAGTGAIGPEIDEGSIVYVLAKPLNRYGIITTKLAVAVGVITCFGALPVLVSGIVLTGEVGTIALAYAVGAFAAGVGYAALYLLLAVVSRNAVVIGLIYALIWESLVGGLVPGAQTLSVQQWGLAVVTEVLGYEATLVGLEAAVSFTFGLVALLLVTVLATAWAGRKLQTLRLGDDG